MIKNKITVIILTFDSAESISKVIDSCRLLAARILVVDSYSTDETRVIAENMGCEVVQHPFENYSSQRNWAQNHANLSADDWVLHLDSDEVLSEELAQNILYNVQQNPERIDGFLMRRVSNFLGQPIRYGGFNPSWHLRLFRASKGHCEHRLYDQHFVVSGTTVKLTGVLHDLQITTIERWTASHNRWSSAEATEVLNLIAAVDNEPNGQLQASLSGDLRMRKRWIKNKVWYRAPLLSRAFIYFFYSYFVKLGFLDGRIGLIYHVLHSFWFRFLVDAKIIEQQLSSDYNHRIKKSPSDTPTN
jgi:glycosyltransferase involved in cell wall biosynthesis